MSGQYRSVFRAGLFAGQLVVVTGGGSGIGRCTAHELSALGAHVVLLGRKLDRLQHVASEIVADGGRCSFHGCDIRDEAAVQDVVQAIVVAHGAIHGLVNNAGGQFISPAEKISANGWEAVVATNLTGGFLLARECFLQSMQAHGGAIVNVVADIWGSMPGMAHSGAARAGMVSFTETTALEWARYGVRVNAVAPGYIASSGMDHYPPEQAPRLRAMQATVPAGRFGNEAETSAGIVFLLSPAASFISGTVLRIDGARPQVRMGWDEFAAGREVQQRAAVRPFDGFHRYQAPRVFADPHPNPLPRAGEGAGDPHPNPLPQAGEGAERESKGSGLPPSPPGRGQG
jgi:citronellol/citronellal dehydrogenase